MVICGAGVIGLTPARELARRGAAVTVIDRVGVAPAASGRAGGFLALDWNDTTALGPLARRSFALHRELAEILDADYGYRTVETIMTVGSESDLPRREPGPEPSEWLDDGVMIRGAIGTHDTTAQVDPRRFCVAVWTDAAAHGAELRTGRVEGIDPTDPGHGALGVLVDGEHLSADAVLVAMGPWTDLLGLAHPPVSGLKGSSIVLAADAPPQVVFSDVVLRDGRYAPEIYPRPDGSVYVCGVPSSDPLPDAPEDVTVDDDDCDTLRRMAAVHSRRLDEAEVVTKQACFRPVTADGLPVIGPVPGRKGTYVATGHGPWGILNAPATAEMLAEMILDGGARTIDPTPYRPDRGSPAMARRNGRAAASSGGLTA